MDRQCSSDYALFVQAREEGLAFRAAIDSWQGPQPNRVWSLPAHPLIQSSTKAQEGLPISSDGCIELVDTPMARDLERHLSFPLDRASLFGEHNTDLEGSPQSGKSAALYMALLALLKKNLNMRLIYVPHRADWLEYGDGNPVAGLRYFLLELMRAFAQDEGVSKGLLGLIGRIGVQGFVDRSLIFHEVLKKLNRIVQDSKLQMHAVVDAAELLESRESTFGYNALNMMDRTWFGLRVTRCGLGMQAPEKRHRHDSECWFRYTFGGYKIGEYRMGGRDHQPHLFKLFKELHVPFDEAHYVALFRQACGQTRQELVKFNGHFAHTWWGLAEVGRDLENCWGSDTESEDY